MREIKRDRERPGRNSFIETQYWQSKIKGLKGAVNLNFGFIFIKDINSRAYCKTQYDGRMWNFNPEMSR